MQYPALSSLGWHFCELLILQSWFLALQTVVEEWRWSWSEKWSWSHLCWSYKGQHLECQQMERGRSWCEAERKCGQIPQSIKAACCGSCAVVQIPQELHQGSPRQLGSSQCCLSSVMSTQFSSNNLNGLLLKNGCSC